MKKVIVTPSDDVIVLSKSSRNGYLYMKVITSGYENEKGNYIPGQTAALGLNEETQKQLREAFLEPDIAGWAEEAPRG